MGKGRGDCAMGNGASRKSARSAGCCYRDLGSSADVVPLRPTPCLGASFCGGNRTHSGPTPMGDLSNAGVSACGQAAGAAIARSLAAALI